MKRRGFLKLMGAALGALTVARGLDAKEEVPPLKKVTVDPPEDDLAIRKVRERWAQLHREDMEFLNYGVTDAAAERALYQGYWERYYGKVQND